MGVGGRRAPGPWCCSSNALERNACALGSIRSIPKHKPFVTMSAIAIATTATESLTGVITTVVGVGLSSTLYAYFARGSNPGAVPDEIKVETLSLYSKMFGVSSTSVSAEFAANQVSTAIAGAQQAATEEEKVTIARKLAGTCWWLPL